MFNKYDKWTIGMFLVTIVSTILSIVFQIESDKLDKKGL